MVEAVVVGTLLMKKQGCMVWCEPKLHPGVKYQHRPHVFNKIGPGQILKINSRQHSPNEPLLVTAIRSPSYNKKINRHTPNTKISYKDPYSQQLSHKA